MIKKSITYIAFGALLSAGISCSKDQLRMKERETSLDVDFFSYSRYHLTSSIVEVARSYGKGVTEEPKEEATLYFLECYNGASQAATLYSARDKDWNYEEQNPYTNQLRKLAVLRELATNENNMANVAAGDILKCVVDAYLTEKYGDVPSSDANQGREGVIAPKFDTQKEIYEQMFTLLDNAVTILSDPNSKGLPSDHDVLFKGDRTKWLKFANSLKFRLMVHSYEAFKKAGRDLSGEMQQIASSGNYISTIAENAALEFPGTSKDESWYLTNWGKSALSNDFTEQKPSKYLIDQMVALDDPRMYVIFAPALSPISAKATESSEDIKINGFTYKVTYYPSSEYSSTEMQANGRDLDGNAITVPYELDAQWIGAPHPINVNTQYASSAGTLNNNSFYDNRRLTGFSQLIAKTTDPRLKAVMMEASEMAFLLAEARQKGWISAGTVKDHYENGIRLSFERWQIENGTKPASHIGSDKIVDNFSNYYAKPTVALDGSNADLDKIALQKWLSLLVTNHTEAYTDYRRTGKPAFIQKIVESFSTYTYPQRYMYPQDELSNNKEQYDAAVSAMGGKDLPSTKMWILQ